MKAQNTKHLSPEDLLCFLEFHCVPKSSIIISLAVNIYNTIKNHYEIVTVHSDEYIHVDVDRFIENKLVSCTFLTV